MDIGIVMVGVDGWQKWTVPAIASIRLASPKAELLVVDAASKTPYPKEDYVLRLDKSPSYAYAINQGIDFMGKKDWYVILNNDINMAGDIHTKLGMLKKTAIYGRQIIQESGHTWLGLWIACISDYVWNKVGRFDENFLICGFEDADYCIRAAALNIPTLPLEFDIYHYWGKTRWGIQGYSDVREDNLNYFQKKHGFRLGLDMRVTHD